MNQDSLSAAKIIETLNMKPHPEGGHYCETFRDQPNADGRGFSTAIYYLLKEGEHSHWHRIDAAELWHFYAGDPLVLQISDNGQDNRSFKLGIDLTAGERPQIVVPPNAWQSARSTGTWTLVGCTVAPAFDFAKFEMAPTNWQPMAPERN